ncbi:rho guanine nucleotide exchange factor 28 [Stegostoma tigrinum]|uniref:rho guanine nucleotide exchange factor 28 n=1 Tax=Stegostoma tigrinum TaxID=3053191 RepID=UPI002870AF38|nr:rho guanine nucleotide exchange factor 28 [Stegostoma tigrinum]
MELSCREVPIYGQQSMLAVFEATCPVPDGAEWYFVYEGSSQNHVTVAQRLNAKTLESVVPGHDTLEDVTVLACTYTEAQTVSILGCSRITYIEDVASKLTQVLVESAGMVDCTSHLTLLEQFGLTREAAQSLDENMTAAIEHLELPPSWNLLGKWSGKEINRKETLLHVSVRLGLYKFSQFLLCQPGGIQAAIVPNEEGLMPVDLALQNGMHCLAEYLKAYLYWKKLLGIGALLFRWWKNNTVCIENSQVTPSVGISKTYGDSHILQKCRSRPNTPILTVDNKIRHSLESDILLLRGYIHDTNLENTGNANMDELKLNHLCTGEDHSEVKEEQACPRNLVLSQSKWWFSFSMWIETNFCSETFTNEPGHSMGSTEKETCVEHASTLGNQAGLLLDGVDQALLDTECKHSSQEFLKKSTPSLSTFLAAARPSSMLNDREEIYVNCMVVDQVNEGSINYNSNKLTSASTSTTNALHEKSSDDHLCRAYNVPQSMESNIPTSLEDNLCKKHSNYYLEDHIDTLLKEDQNDFTEQVSDLSSPDSILCRSSLLSQQHDCVKAESLSTSIKYKQRFSFDGIDADSEGEEVSDRSPGSCTPKSPNSVALFASSGDELDSFEIHQETEINIKESESRSSSNSLLPKESEDTGIRLRSYSLSSPKVTQSKSRFMKDFGVFDSPNEDGVFSSGRSLLQALSLSKSVSLLHHSKQRTFSLPEHPKEKRELSFRKWAQSADEEGSSELADSLQHLTLSEFLKEIEEEEWGKYIIPSKAETEKCKVSRTFSFLKNRMTSTRNKGKGKHKDPKEKEKWSNGHHFIAGIISGTLQCMVCDKLAGGKDVLQCFNCTMSIHKSCRDSVPMCIKAKYPNLQDKCHVTSRSKPTHCVHSNSLKDASQPAFLSMNSTSSSLPIGLFAVKRETLLQHQPLSKSASSISVERRITESMDMEVDSYVSRSKSQSEELLQTMGTSPSTELLALEDNVVPSIRGELEFDAQEFKAESWSLAVDHAFSSKQQKDLIQRQDVIYELMQTEMHHIRTLEIMSEIFRKGMKEELQLDHNTIDKIFPSLDELLEIHKHFFFCLKERRRESFEEDSERNFFISKIGDILLQQFADENGDKLKQTYGDFCSHHKEAVSFFKELQQQNKKFQNFIRQQSNNLLVRRLGVPECILLVTQRITKYPVLLERILQYTKEGTEENEDVAKSLSMIKDIIAAVDTKVNKYEKEQKLLDILNKFENKTCGKLKNGRIFRKQDLIIKGRELQHEGSMYWKTATGRLKDITALLLTDVLIFLQEKDQKYTFATVDQKPAVILLQKLIVREVANEERGMFLISASSAGPEMYEMHTNSKEDRNNWMRLIRMAVESCPEEEEERLSEYEEDKRIAEARAARTQKFQERLRFQDQLVCSSLEEKLQIYAEMAERNGYEEAGQETQLLIKPDTVEFPQAGFLLTAAVREAESLHRLLTSQPCNFAEQSREGLEEAVMPQKLEMFGSFSLGVSQSSVYVPDAKIPDPQLSVVDSMMKQTGSVWYGFDTPFLQTDGELYRPRSHDTVRKVVHSVQNITQLLYSLQAVVTMQDSYIEVQRLILQERERSAHIQGTRGNLLLEQEKQRNMEKQREELTNVRKLQSKLYHEQKRWERECERRQREQEAQESRLQEREQECQQQAEQMWREREELESQWKEYQQNLERLREGMRMVEKERDKLEAQQKHLNAWKHSRQRSLPVMMFPQETSQVPIHTRTGSLGGGGVDTASVFVNEAALQYSPNNYQRASSAQTVFEPHKVESTLNSIVRINENLKNEVPVQLRSATNQLLKPTGIQQQIPTKLASFSKGDREKTKASCDQENYIKEMINTKDNLEKASSSSSHVLLEHQSVTFNSDLNIKQTTLSVQKPASSTLHQGGLQSQHEMQLLVQECSYVPQESKHGQKDGAEEENVFYF